MADSLSLVQEVFASIALLKLFPSSAVLQSSSLTFVLFPLFRTGTSRQP